MSRRLRRTRTRAGWIAGAILLGVYLATLAPDVTFWDAGEFIAAAHSLGIPHPPGTPLFVLMLHVWAWLLHGVPYAIATNSFSAASTALAAAVSSRLVVRGEDDEATRRGWYALAGALCAGSMSSVWLNANETEVYAASLALSALTLVCADRAGRLGSRKWRLFTAYLVVLSVPLHLSALLATPAAVYLASSRDDGAVDVRSGVALTGVFLIAVGAGKMSVAPAVAGVLLVILSPLAPRAAARWLPRHSLRRRVPGPMLLLWASATALSILLFMLIRARHDPTINQGAPSDLPTLAYAVARRQYDVPPLWPRGAPLWLQIGNVFEYADWQVALALGPTPIPTIARTATTILFAVLGGIGALAQWRVDRRRCWALVLLLLCGSIGAAVYLNMRASPSFAWGILPASAQREARERDYFFVLGFWAWGLWAGYGVMTLVARLRWPPVIGAVVAALPIALNWNAVTRRSEPGAVLPRALAESILGSAPPRSVLFVEGDNDTYPLWFLQEVEGFRRDVTVVTIPLLPAEWYRRELSRREDLIPGQRAAPAGTNLAPQDAPISLTELEDVAARARELGRPVAAAVSVREPERNRLGRSWTVRGMVYVARTVPDTGETPRFMVDSAATRSWSERISTWVGRRTARSSTDSIDDYALGLLACPHLSLETIVDRARSDSLASLCNRR